MPLTLQEISDRLEIQDLLIDYSHALDSRDFDAFDDLFTDDAYIDYTELGGAAGDLPSIKAFLRKVMPTMAGYQHLVATSKVTIDGDEATGRTLCHNPMILGGGEDGEDQVFFCGLWYVDTFRRTPDGWRIARRVEEKCYVHGLPERPPR